MWWWLLSIGCAHWEFRGQVSLRGGARCFFPHRILYHSKLAKDVGHSEVSTNLLGFIWDLGGYFHQKNFYNMWKMSGRRKQKEEKKNLIFVNERDHHVCQLEIDFGFFHPKVRWIKTGLQSWWRANVWIYLVVCWSAAHCSRTYWSG